MGFPLDAMAFYVDLTADNSREFWQANKPRYDASVKAPMSELVGLLSDEFGPAKLYRPNRDVRFSADKSPYKTHQGGSVMTAPACGWYLELNADEIAAGGGFYHAEAPALARYRAAVDDRRSGVAFQKIMDELIPSGWQVGGEQVATAPRGYARDHPRIELLRHKSLYVANEVDPSLVGVEQVAERVAQLWRTTRPLVEWCSKVLAG